MNNAFDNEQTDKEMHKKYVIDSKPTPTFLGAKCQAWSIPSSSEPGTNYIAILTEDGDKVCSCPGFRFRQECKHIKALPCEKD